MFTADTLGSGKFPKKIAIPRLPQKRTDPPKKSNIHKQHRVNRACLSCRARKIKCNGAIPTCSICIENATTCVYASSRKDRLKIATSQNQDMVALLRELRAQAPFEQKSKIDNLLATVVDDVAEAAATLQRSPERPAEDDHGDDEEQGGLDASAEVGSSADLDRLDEDLHDQQPRAAGYIGKASEMQWLRKLHGQGLDGENESPYYTGQSVGTTTDRLTALSRREGHSPASLMPRNSASFFLDDEQLDLDLDIEPFELPPFEIAERLVHVYMESCHNSFPLLAKKAFIDQFYHYYAASKRGHPYEAPQKWQAQLNIVFAVGAVYSHLTSLGDRWNEQDHLIYHSRAWALSFKDPCWFSQPDLPQMQTIGLLSFYYLSIGHINRSWVLIGMALRFGYALGLHVRNEDQGTGPPKKEVLLRIWWAHYTLEGLLATMTGRPGVGINKSCSVALPLPLSSQGIEYIESQPGERTTSIPNPTLQTQSAPSADLSTQLPNPLPSNSGSYLKSLIQIGAISQDALSLYTASTVGESWQSVQQSIGRLIESIKVWAKCLPEALSFIHSNALTEHRYGRERVNLEILYHGTLILMTRPCLCRLDRRIVNRTVRLNNFNRQSALVCVDSAKSVAMLLPEDPEKDLTILYQAGPWWAMVHTIMQSLVVLLLEISHDAQSYPYDPQGVLPLLKKLIRWLRAMRVNNEMARRAYSIVMDLLRVLVSRTKMDISDLFEEDEQANHAAVVSAAQGVQSHASRSASVSTFQAEHNNRDLTSSDSAKGSIPREHDHFQKGTRAHAALDDRSAPHDPALYTSHSSDENTPVNAYPDLFSDSWGKPYSALPNFFFTSFDEQNPFPGFAAYDYPMGGLDEQDSRPPAGN